jgi:hypothetical protein
MFRWGGVVAELAPIGFLRSVFRTLDDSDNAIDGFRIMALLRSLPNLLKRQGLVLNIRS